ncbi:dienelactone hydrolase family protein [Streptomyces sp. G44]|uniref:dienelactone hydrolase family protein n=1 Tax=Streptomyces sp. G44 TaxID=2807632 RepID=UPI0027DB4C70|nr:dienelactone hydrolase family protein [Streptomyces sp. G44]
MPHLNHRHGPAPVIGRPEQIGTQERPEFFARVTPLAEAHATERVLRDADASLGFRTAQPEVTAGPIPVNGSCMGAVLAMRTAAAHPDRVVAAAGLHPGLAENDMSPEDIGELTAALDAAGAGHTCEVDPDTVHGCTMADTETDTDTDAFDASAPRRHWERPPPLLDRTVAAAR